MEVDSGFLPGLGEKTTGVRETEPATISQQNQWWPGRDLLHSPYARSYRSENKQEQFR